MFACGVARMQVGGQGAPLYHWCLREHTVVVVSFYPWCTESTDTLGFVPHPIISSSSPPWFNCNIALPLSHSSPWPGPGGTERLGDERDPIARTASCVFTTKFHPTLITCFPFRCVLVSSRNAFCSVECFHRLSESIRVGCFVSKLRVEPGLRHMQNIPLHF